MINSISLDEKYSTTRLLTKEKPIVNSLEDKFETVLFLPEGEERKGEGGLRTKGYFKKSYEKQSLISIITVVYNGEKFLEETIQSVIHQTYNNVEYIIIDGGSTDGTLDIIKKYEDKVDYWMSKRDSGIYDAMNKGIDLASGEWINFMNGGDLFYKNQVLENIFYGTNNNADIIYGDTVFNYPTFQKKVKANTNINDLWKGMCFTHQSTFIKSNLHKNNKFIKDMKIGADFAFLYNSYKKNVIFKYSNTTISIMDIGGISYTDRISSIKDHYSVVLKYDNSLKIKIYYKYLILLNRFKIIIKRILPNSIINYIQK